MNGECDVILREMLKTLKEMHEDVYRELREIKVRINDMSR